MEIQVFASGSSGNCLLVSCESAHILIDAGISARRIEAALRQTGYTMREIDGVLITHEHSDHISGLATLCKRWHVPVYAPRIVASRLWAKLPEIDGCVRIIPVGERFQIGTAAVLAFHTPHDTDESVGYRVEAEGVFALATDMGHVSEEVVRGLSGAGTVLIESNHDEQMLCDGPYPVYLKRRILSDHGHLPNASCAALARRLAESGTEHIILGHLSRENNRPQLALDTSRAALGALPAHLYCAPESGCLTVPVPVGERAACFL